jgi:phage shock protein A
MPTAFDALRAAREELGGLVDVQRTLLQRERACEEAMGKAEQELNAIRKITGYVRISMDAIRQRITELEKQT